MLKFIAYRLVMAIPVLLGVVVIVFTLSYITPGDVTAARLDPETATEEDREALREELGLNGGYFERLGRYGGDLVRFDLGTSHVSGHDIGELIASRVKPTVVIAVGAAIVATLFGVILGIGSAVRPYSKFDDIVMTFSLIGVSMPNFWLGLLLILFFSLRLGWLPAGGYDDWKSIVLPVVTLAGYSMAVLARITRGSMLEVLHSPYIATARAKGASEFMVVTRHGLRNSLLPIITAAGLQFGMMLGGSVIIETIFTVPGLGKLLVDSIATRDFPVVQSLVLVIAVMFVLVNLIVDVFSAYADPRLRTQFDLGARGES